MTSKLQVTLPKALADQYGIGPGDDLQWVASGEVIHVRPGRIAPPLADTQFRLRLFDRATARQKQRQGSLAAQEQPLRRGWRREELYQNGRRSR